MADLDPDTWYELCPECEGECDCCLTCMDEPEPHVCSDAAYQAHVEANTPGIPVTDPKRLSELFD